MIINKIRLQEEHPMTGSSDSWPLPLCDLNLNANAGANGYILKDSVGFAPPALVSVVEGFDQYGIPIMGSIPEKREIALKIGLNPQLGQTYSSLRDALYKYIDRSVFVKLMNDAKVIAQTSGYIRQFDATHFSNLPDIQMTIECETGEFSSPVELVIPTSEVNTLHPIINYEEGTAPTGMELTFTVTASHDGFSISNHSRFWHAGEGDVSNVFQMSYPLITGDVVTFCTQPRDKHITLVRSLVTYDLAGYINAGAVWPKLYSGVNTFDWDFSSSWMTWTSATYIPKYWGV